MPLAAVLLVLYLADIVLSVRSAIQIGSRLAKLHAIQDEFSRKLEELRAEQQRAWRPSWKSWPRAGSGWGRASPPPGRRREPGPTRPLRPFRPGWSPWGSSVASSPSAWSR